VNPVQISELEKPPENCPNFFRHVVAMGMSNHVSYEGSLLDVEIEADPFDKPVTLRTYLKGMLRKLWSEGESFNGKRPFGNSGWKFQVYKSLIEAKAVPGKLDEDGYVEEVDTDKVDKAIIEAIVEEL
jgi:hypothetical protein